MADLRLEENELAESASRLWWLYLITGILWLWVTLIILSFDYDSVYAVAILFGFVAIGAGISEFLAIGASTSGWKVVHGLLGVLFIAAGVVAFFRPAGTFAALAAIVAWVLLFKGIFDIVLALVSHPEHLWWVGLIVGVIEILVAFWAAGYFRGSAILLVAWIGALTLMRGITEIVMAFRLRRLKKATPAAA
ncbi:MAG: HdeD family acid-resistance protein [Gaiellaceae bacterium]